MQLRYELQGGWPSQLTNINRRLGGFKKRSSAFKIGITNCPKKRIEQYENDYPKHFGEMIVLYKTSSLKNVRELEKQLIEENWDDERLFNLIGGGGGKAGEGPYYLYIVRRRRK